MIKFLRAFALIFSLIFSCAKAQDPQFSQYYANPLFLNPGFTGANLEARAGLIYRNQWPSIDQANFQTVALYADKYFADQRSGVGFLLVRDQAGDIGLTSTTFNLSYSYQIPISEKLTFRPGINFGYITQDQDFSELFFASQFDPNSGLFDPSSPNGLDLTGTERVNSFDIGLGGVVYGPQWWFGFAGHHLNEPSRSIIGDDNVNIDARYTFHGGYKIPLRNIPFDNPNNPRRELSLTPTVQYKFQGDFDQVDVGMYLTYEPINFGVWYRGIPIKNVSDQTNSEAIIGMVALSTNGGLVIGYSYDYTISDLGISSGGAHELTLTYNFILRNRRIPPRERRIIPCPKI
ncbi:MAG: type IX secretion system membrane protein PorP/SprF [Bacteroidota bacterium]